ncbi:rhomboid family intramembrane serine protease [Marinobacter bohaiensis]|uniref:rhomboid family intramembrane serine protease n=1 Tax=Marinobacter bohaiensis TaxID=2201898 RepID=UPI000DAC8CD4|nr:rhomboid family intramembrane serine protease [Marinobacter bohaiensis]
MLILPLERSVDWRRPPWMTLAIMLACLLVFLFYQGNDDRLGAQATQAYLTADLDRLEAPAYETYLQRQINLDGNSGRQDRLDLLRQAMANDNRPLQAALAMGDPDFYAYLQDNRDVIWNSEQRAYWLTHRPPIETEYLDRLSGRAAGVVPAELSLADLITYQFLHGGWGHLIGNMVVLFVLGITVEKALGGLKFLLTYLACGAVSGAIWAGFEWGLHTSLVGASGSIAGLMGMYMALFGRQRIRFFYSLGFYFGYFRAPALVLLPVCIGKEIYDYFFAGATGVAYLAHAGGLLVGAGLVWLLGRSWLQPRETFFEPEDEEQEARFRSAYAQAMTLLGRFEFEQARLQFEALYTRYPERPVLLEHLYHLAKLRPDQETYRERARELMASAQARHQPEQMLEIWQEYQSKGQPHHPLSARDHNRALFAGLRSGDTKTAERVFERLRATGDQDLTLEACRLLADEFDKRNMAPKARHYRQMMSAAGGA